MSKTLLADVRPFPEVTLDPLNSFFPATIYAVNAEDGSKTPMNTVDYATDAAAALIAKAMGGVVEQQAMPGFVAQARNVVVFSDASYIYAGYAADLIFKQQGYYLETGTYVGQNRTYKKF